MYFSIFCLVIVLMNGEINDKAHAALPTVTQAIDTILKSWYPEDAAFDDNCVSDDCPELRSVRLCPQEFITNDLYSVLEAATGCMKEPICGIVIDTRPTPNVTCDLAEIFSAVNIDGTSTVLPNTAFLTNISKIQLPTQPDPNPQLPFEISISIPNMRSYGKLKLDLSLRQTHSISSSPLSVTIPQIIYDVVIEFAATIHIQPSSNGPYLDIRVLDQVINVHPTYGNLTLPAGFPNIQTLFTSMTKDMTEKSSWAARQAAFLEKYLQSVFRIVSKNC